MMNLPTLLKPLRLALALCLFGAFMAPALAEPQLPSHSNPLLKSLQKKYRPKRTIKYSKARRKLFSDLRRSDNRVKLVYTTDFISRKGVPDHTKINCEHTWPKSKFRRLKSIKSDLHHLFPTRSRVNAERSSKPFAEIPDHLTQSWWASPQALRKKPRKNIDKFAESTKKRFEPPENHKGDVARAMFYVYLVYHDRRIDLNWFKPQLKTLVQWHKMDPPDREEIRRNRLIAKIQGNQNPFISNPRLVEKLFGR